MFLIMIMPSFKFAQTILLHWTKWPAVTLVSNAGPQDPLVLVISVKGQVAQVKLDVSFSPKGKIMKTIF